MKDRFRLAAVDLDDTLLGPDHRISARNFAAVRALKEAGIAVVIASGRMHGATVRFAEELGLEGPILSYNGAMVRTHPSGELLHHVPVPPALAAEVVEYCEQNGHPLNYYLDDRLYVRERTAWSDLYHSRTQSVIHEVGSLRQFEGRSPTKLLLLGESERIRGLAGEFQERYHGRLNVLISNVEYLEFMAPTVSKALGLEVIGRHLGIPREEMVAFGDSGNDVAMLEYSGFGVAMGNARPEVKAVADHVGRRNDEDGFALAVEEIVFVDLFLRNERKSR